MPLLTVIVPTYNRPQHLEKCLASLDSQTWQSYELLVCDDGSTIPYAEGKCEKIHRPSNVVRIEKNVGEVRNVYAGMEMAHGDYVFVLHDDDVLADERVFEEAKYYLETYKPGMLMCAHQTVKNTKDGPEYHRHYLPFDGWITEKYATLILDANPTIMGGFFVKKSLLAEIGYLDCRYTYYSDWDLLIRLTGLEGFSVYYLRRVITTYLLHPQSQTAKLEASEEAKTRELDMIAGLVRMALAPPVDTTSQDQKVI